MKIIYQSNDGQQFETIAEAEARDIDLEKAKELAIGLRPNIEWTDAFDAYAVPQDEIGLFIVNNWPFIKLVMDKKQP